MSANSDTESRRQNPKLFSLEGHDSAEPVPVAGHDDISRITAEMEAAEIARDEAAADIVRLERELSKAREAARSQACEDNPEMQAEIAELIAFVRADQKACAAHPNANPNAWQMREREGVRDGEFQRWHERTFVGPASMVQFPNGTVADLEGVDLSKCPGRRSALAAKAEVHSRRKAFRWCLTGLGNAGGAPLTEGDLIAAIAAVRSGNWTPLKKKLADLERGRQDTLARDARTANERSAPKTFMAQ